MSRLLMHFAIPSQRFPDVAKIGIARVAIFAWRCGSCNVAFYLDRKPAFCPMCRAEFTSEEAFGKVPA